MRRSFTLFSILVHAVLISAALIAQVLAVGSLPTPHQPILFDAASIMPADIKLPKPPQRAAPKTSSETSASINAAPLSPPTGVAPESGREGEPTMPNGIVVGVTNGIADVADVLGVGNTAPPPPPPPPTKPVRLTGGIKAPLKITDVPPAYPPMARTARVQGVVILEAVIDTQGAVESVRVLRSIPLLDQAAMEAVQQWKFTPALLNSQPVPVVMTVTVNFVLQDR